MEVILVIHLILALAIIGLVLLQRSEGGGLVSTGGGMGSFASAQGTANALSRMTAICAASFFVTSLILGIMAGSQHNKASLIDRLDQPVPAVAAEEVPAPQEAPAAPVSE